MYTFLAQHDREAPERTGNTNFWHLIIEAWWNAIHGEDEKFDGTARSTSKYLSEIAKASYLRNYKPKSWNIASIVFVSAAVGTG